MKDAFYFPHDSNAKDDPKCSMLIEQLGLEGYGIYWVLVETLRDQPNYRYPLSMLSIIARKYNTTAEKVRVVVGNYGLFTVTTDEFFLSESLCRRMERVESMREANRAKGLKSGEVRRLLAQGKITVVEPVLNCGSTGVEPVLNCGSTGVEPGMNKRKEIKEKKTKLKDIYGTYQNVKLTSAEYDRLKNEFSNADEAINFFSKWIEEKGGTKSKDHNLAIRRWVIDAVSKNKGGSKRGKTYEEIIAEGLFDD